MKKEKVVVQILTKSIMGFFIGVTLLMIAYMSVYFISGQYAFANEISQLQNIKTLVSQIIITGLVYYILFVSFQINLYLQSRELITGSSYKMIFKTMTITILITLLIVSIQWILLNNNIYSRNIVILNIIELFFSYIIGVIYFSIKFFKGSKVIEKINQKLKERNK